MPPVAVPAALDVVGEQRFELEGLTEGDLPLQHVLLPQVVHHRIAVLRAERPHVAEE